MVDHGSRIGRGRRLALLVLCLTLVLSGLDMTIMNVAASDVVARFRAGEAARIWVVNGYELTVASLLLTAGLLAVRWGPRRAFLIGLGVFGAGSVLGATASGIGTVITARVVLGAGYALIMSATLGLLRAIFRRSRERSRALGYWTASSSLGMALGPLLGGALVQVGGWRAAFLVNLPVVLAALAGGWRALPVVAARRVRLDGPGALLSVAALGVGSYAVQSVADRARITVDLLPPALLALVLAAGFAVRQHRAPHPLVPPALLAPRTVRAAMALIAASFGGYAGLIYLLTRHLRQVDGVSPVAAGLAIVPLALANVVGSATAPSWAARWGTGPVLVGASAGATLGFLALGAAGLPYGYLGVPLVGAGVGALFTVATDLMLGSAPPERAAQVGAVQETCFSAGGGLGVGLLGTLLVLGTAAAGGEHGARLWWRAAPAEAGFGLTVLAVGGCFILLTIWVACRPPLPRGPRPAGGPGTGRPTP